MAKGNPVQPVVVVTDADLVQNGGRYILGGGKALPVDGQDLATSIARKNISGGKAMPVYIVDSATPVGVRDTIGGKPLRVVELAAISGRGIEGRVAQPVYVSSGTLGTTPLDLYIQKILGIAPGNLVAYWTMQEVAGTNAANAAPSGALRDGVYARNVTTMTTVAGPVGGTAPLFTNDIIDIETNSLEAGIDYAEGSLFVWAKVSAAGVWTDGVTRGLVQIRIDNNNTIQIAKAAGNNQMNVSYIAGGTTLSRSKTSYSPTGWFNVGLSWSLSAGADGEVKAYFDGAQEGATLTTLGTWVGTEHNPGLIGAASAAPGFVWSGPIAHVPMWDTPLTGAQMAIVATP